MVITWKWEMKGGVALSQENQSFLRFTLEESVWFQKGQEVAEFVSISLDPNITIIENDQYVAIRGSLELTGEYKRIDEDSQDQEDVLSAPPKFVQSVEEREEGICEFLHRFPVDITIPNNRIQSVYDIDVTVDSFDYVLPERSCLKLVADLTISGLYGEQQHVPIEDGDPSPEYVELMYDREEEEVGVQTEASLEEIEEETPELEPMYRSEQEDDREESHTYSPNFILSYPTESAVDELEDESAPFDYSQPFSAEAKRQPEESQEPEHKWGSPTPTQSPSIPKLPDFSFSEKREDSNQAEEIEDKQPPSIPKLSNFSFAEKREDSNQTKKMEEDTTPSPSFEIDVKVVTNQVEEAESPVLESSSSSSSSPEKPGLLKKFTKKKSMSIAEFLGRKTENEHQAKLRVCIVQNGDTLDSISDRYALPVQQILRVNHLEANQDVYEGQVLYIPETAASR